MIHIDRRHPELGGAANPIRQAKSLENIPNDMKSSTKRESSRTNEGWKYYNPYLASIFSSNTAYSSVMPFHTSPVESLLRRYEDRQKELETKLMESERSRTSELLETYRIAMKVNEVENWRRIGGNFDAYIMSEMSKQIAIERLTPFTSQSNLSDPQIQVMLAILAKHVEFTENMVKCMESMKRSQDVRDEDLTQILFGGLRDSQPSYSKAEQLMKKHKAEVVSELSSGVGEKNDSLYDGQKEMSSRKEPEQSDFVNLSGPSFEMSSSNFRQPSQPRIDSALFYDKNTPSHMSSREPESFGDLIGQDTKQRKIPNPNFSTTLKSQDQFAQREDHGFHWDRVADELSELGER
jgi:hypothetical protein